MSGFYAGPFYGHYQVNNKIGVTDLYLHVCRYCIFNVLSSYLATQPQVCNKLIVSVHTLVTSTFTSL